MFSSALSLGSASLIGCNSRHHPAAPAREWLERRERLCFFFPVASIRVCILPSCPAARSLSVLLDCEQFGSDILLGRLTLSARSVRLG